MYVFGTQVKKYFLFSYHETRESKRNPPTATSQDLLILSKKHKRQDKQINTKIF